MATLAEARPAVRGDERFFFYGAIVMIAVLVVGFSNQLIAGRSTFAAPWPVHVHAVLFFGWAFFYLFQTVLATSGSVALHRRTGWIALVWLPAMIAVALGVIVAMVRAGTTPFIFTPSYFLIMDVLVLVAFAGLIGAGLRMRRRTDWHRRLMFSGMAVLIGPGIGRLLPMPLLMPWAGEAVFAVQLLFPVAGMVADQRRTGRVHPAWWWGLGVMLAMQTATEVIGRGPIGGQLHAAVATGTPGATVDPFAHPLPPADGLITGR
jgi:hypothetical protein